MTAVYLTIDTEYTAHLPGAGGGPGTRADNFAHSIACQTASGAVGISHQMDVLERYGLKGVFFVDPMPALLWGVEAIADVVCPIAERGHDVQLHCHTEWLDFVPDCPLVDGRRGRNLKNFSMEDQTRILRFARDTLVAAGATAPTAFRAGNYGANDDTLHALSELGLSYDTSHAPALAREGADCAIALGTSDRQPLGHCGIVEVPIGCIGASAGRMRHGQLTALSLRELCAALRHAEAQEIDSFTLVSHSFELLSRDRRRINRMIARRFDRLCAAIAAMPGVTTATYAERPPSVLPHAVPDMVLPHHPLRGGLRVIEQAIANTLYNGSPRPRS